MLCIIYNNIQWDPSKPATLGTSESVLVRGVATFQGRMCIKKHVLGLLSGLNTGVATFPGVLIRGVPLYMKSVSLGTGLSGCYREVTL